MATLSTNKVLILGGGLIGLSIAHALAKKGKSVEVLSRRRHEAAGFVAAGMLAPHAEGLQGNLLKLGQASLNQINNWVNGIEKDSGKAKPDYCRHPYDDSSPTQIGYPPC